MKNNFFIRKEAEEETIIEKRRNVHNIDRLPGLMKAVRIHEFGGTEKLIYEEAPIPLTGPDEVLIRVHSAGVNPLDWKIREGNLKDKMQYRLPLILGSEVAGTVVHTGILVTRFDLDDVVFARTDMSRDGCYAEFVAVKANDVAFSPSIPASMAAGIPMASQTAWMGLFEVGNLKQDQKILIHGASGGVGTFAVQLAKIAGAYVIGTTSDKNIALVKSLGADEVIDYKNEDFRKKTKDLDMVFDTIGGETQARSWEVLKKEGILVSTLSIDENAAAKNKRTGKSFFANSNGARLQEIAGLIDKRMLHVIIDKEFSLEEIAKAHELSQSGKARGKIIIRIYDEKYK